MRANIYLTTGTRLYEAETPDKETRRRKGQEAMKLLLLICGYFLCTFLIIMLYLIFGNGDYDIDDIDYLYYQYREDFRERFSY